jgi:hypothetical protein
LISKIRETLGSDYSKVPVYLLHGDLTQSQMNGLYHHPKVKAMLNFTKGEGFGRPLLEFSLTGKPVIVSAVDGLDSSKYGLKGVIKVRGALIDPAAMHYCYLISRTEMTLTEVGGIFGSRDHTTVIHAKKSVNDSLTSKFDNEYKTHIENLNVIL